MLAKQERIIISFETTTQAMAMESLCKGQQIPGRLIPLPKSISAGCGMAWSAPIGEERALLDFIDENSISFQEIHTCFI